MSVVSMPAHYPVACHTDNVMPGGIFVAIDGYKLKGTDYIMQAITCGASTIVTDQNAVISQDCLRLMESRGIAHMIVENTRRALAELSAQAAGNPAKKLCIIGVTGTKGKSTTSFLLAHLFANAGYKTALLSTVHNMINGTIFTAPLTTAQPDYLHQFLKICAEQNVAIVVMEVAAQAQTLYRTHGIEFEHIIFTNFSQEHAEFYPTLQDYFDAKCSLIGQLKEDGALFINKDSQWLTALAGNTQAVSMSMLDEQADYYCSLDQMTPQLQGVVCTAALKVHFSCRALLGSYNAYNVMAAAAVALHMGIAPDSINTSLQSFEGVPGRLQQFILPNGARCFIDYAHNPSSFEQLFILLRSMTDQLIVVFGAGGQRDKVKRPIMGSLATLYADQVILTNDNPRTEDPQSIIDDILQGVTPADRAKVICQPDRELAIKYAYALSKPSAIIALLGKGPDEYQIFGVEKIYFSEKAIVQSL